VLALLSFVYSVGYLVFNILLSWRSKSPPKQRPISGVLFERKRVPSEELPIEELREDLGLVKSPPRENSVRLSAPRGLL